MATWPNSNATQGKFTSIAADTRVALVARVMPLPYRRLTGRWVLVHTGVVELLTIIIEFFTIILPS
jgi:hydrogenase maturation factor